MKKLFIFILLLLGLQCFASQHRKSPVIVAYVTSWSRVMPDPTLLTQINYAFGHVDSTFSKVEISNVNRLKDIVRLKNAKTSLKVVLSIGGWTSGNFSEMAADKGCRKLFVADCKQKVKEFGFDGIDIDWEYPTSSVAGISSSPADTENFTLLIKELRKALGKKRVLSIASIADGKYIDFASIDKYIDYVNIMTYDIDNPPYHHAPLYRSNMVGHLSCEEAVKAHIAAGMSINKIVLGIPFYGHATKEIPLQDYKDLMLLKGYQRHWDNIAEVPYLTDSMGNFVCSYEDSVSIRYKCQFIRQNKLRGAMYWEYSGDDENGTLRKAVYQNIFINDNHKKQ
jgi:chitinase